jgi:hypothetical protein
MAGEAAVTPDVKPGTRTTEFWTALGTIVLLMLPVLHITAAPDAVREVLAAVAGLVTAGYAVARAIVKAAHSHAAAAAPSSAPTQPPAAG